MKNLLLLLFIPFVSFGQDFDFDDIKKIDSENKFKMLMLENGFVKVESNEWKTTYAYNYNKSKETATMWAHFTTMSGRSGFEFEISRNYNGSSQPVFTRIFEQVKRECWSGDFVETMSGDEYAIYTCPNTPFTPSRPIAFRRGISGFDYIRTLTLK